MNTTRTIDIPARANGVNGVSVQPVSGNFFRCLSATAAFKMSASNGALLTMSAGRGFGSTERNFRMLNFQNESAGVITVEFYAGSDPYEGDQTTTISGAATIANELANCIAATPTQLLKTTTIAASPAQVNAAAIYFRQAIVMALKTLAGALNTSDVALGFSATANQQPITIPPGGSYVFEPPNGSKWNLADLYLTVATNGDGAVILYT